MATKRTTKTPKPSEAGAAPLATAREQEPNATPLSRTGASGAPAASTRGHDSQTAEGEAEQREATMAEKALGAIQRLMLLDLDDESAVAAFQKSIEVPEPASVEELRMARQVVYFLAEIVCPSYPQFKDLYQVYCELLQTLHETTLSVWSPRVSTLIFVNGARQLDLADRSYATLVQELPRVEPKFARLRQMRAQVLRCLTKKTELFGTAADLSLLVGAFGDVRKEENGKLETAAEAHERVAKAYRRALERAKWKPPGLR